MPFKSNLRIVYSSASYTACLLSDEGRRHQDDALCLACLDKISQMPQITQRLCVKASGLGLCQAPQHETDHSDENPGFFTAGEHFIVFGEPSPCRKPGESALDNPSMWKHMKAAGTDLLPIDDGILWSPDAS